ncbi:hypothetical protein ColLi_08234 [Colletotrichum liriopes]|uniref:Pantothenate transporter n=1 Tax=Colletotrichum liriopes TaxID=708192 RepID=A0AA37GQJ8_9PEZI|nr:hypothetical protein ColLi_08234 [Colletotrichum liriopes]
MTADNIQDAQSAIYSACNGDVRTAKRVGKENIVPDDATTLSNSELARGAALTALTVEEEKKLIRKVDWRLIPLLAMLYLVKKLDESNVSQARIMNKGTERNILAQLGVTSDQYGMVTVLYTTEAGMFPGIILQLSYWYRPDEIAVRLMWIFPGNTKWLSPVESAFLQARLPPNSPRSSERNFAGSEIMASLKDKRLWLFTLSWALMTCGKNGIDFYRPTIIANMGFRYVHCFYSALLVRGNMLLLDTETNFSDIATAQVLNIPTSALAIFLILWLGIWSNKAKIPLPLFPIGCTIVIVAMYSILVVYPNDIGVYLGMMIGVACGTAWFPFEYSLMWPWRAQTVNGATGSAFAIGFVNSYGQVGDALGPQMFQEKYAPSYQLPFGLSMGLIGLCGIVNGVTWWVTRRTENDTRKHKRARILARKNNEAVLDDVVDLDLERKLRV